MKKIIVLVCVFIVSCAPNVLKKDALMKTPKVALVSVSCNKKVDTSEIGGIVNLVSELINYDKLQLGPVVEELKSKAIRDNKAMFPFSLIDERQLFRLKEFSEMKKHENMDSDIIAAEKYPKLSMGQKDQIIAFLKSTKSVDGAMSIYVHYSLYESVSVAFLSTTKAKAWLIVSVYNKDSQEPILMKTIEESSDSSIMTVMGKYDEAKVAGLCNEATKNAYKSFGEWVKKESKTGKLDNLFNGSNELFIVNNR